MPGSAKSTKFDDSCSQINAKMPVVYSVEMFAEGTHLFSSSSYDTREDVEDLIKYMRDVDPKMMTFQVYKHSPRSCSEVNEWYPDNSSNHVSDEDSNSQPNLYGMTFEKYGKGYLLRPMPDCTFIGQKYLHDGWWMTRHDAWFFKADYYDILVDLGAEFVTDHDTDMSAADSDVYSSFNGLTMNDYGRGLMVYPNKSHRHYGKKYMGDGFWNNRAKGWFFKNDMFDTLMEAQVVYKS